MCCWSVSDIDNYRTQHVHTINLHSMYEKINTVTFDNYYYNYYTLDANDL